MKASFIETGDFFSTSGIKRLEPFKLERRIYPLLNVIFWQFATSVPICYYLMKMLFSGELLYFSIGAGIVGAFFLLLKKTIGMSEIKKGSSYGSGATPKKHQ